MVEAGIWRVAVPSPLHQLFDYRAPHAAPAVAPGVRVRVPFGRRQVVGVLIDTHASSALPNARLKSVAAVLDDTPLLPPELMQLAQWAADYYHHPLGEVLATLLPVRLRQGQSATASGTRCWRLTRAGRALDEAGLARAPRQREIVTALAPHADGLDVPRLQAIVAGGAVDAGLRALRDKGLVEDYIATAAPSPTPVTAAAPALNADQAAAVAAIRAATGFAAFLLEGVTGSGKTEVYLQAMAAVLAAGQQVLVLVPEIGLTPQLVARFRDRLGLPLAVLHSGLNDQQRLDAWLAAGSGQAPIVIGTRSAVFTPLARPGLIIVDEEHDLSFKQQDGFRYHARDLAVVRAHQLGVPVVLGSATPALESLHNVNAGRYTRLHLPERAGCAVHPRIQVLDVRQRRLQDGLSAPLLDAIDTHLAQGGQALVFLNRRGYAPTLLCHACGWVAQCPRCDTRLIVHRHEGRLRCHHCQTVRPLPAACPDCDSSELRPLGQGTERVEQTLAARFADIERVRVDRDSTRAKGALEDKLTRAEQGTARLLLGTQMLAKGHHFPAVTLAAIVDADQGLYGADFRSGERMAQLIVQVAGRAGRAERPGEVLIQTHHPDHPLLQTLVRADYAACAAAILREREQAGLPPYSHIALLRAEAATAAAPEAFLREALALAEALAVPGVLLLGPVPAPMPRRAGRHRAQLLLQAERRADLQRLLGAWVPQLSGLKSARKARWSLDVDAMEML